MKVRVIAGLGMTLLAAGLMTIYFLDPDWDGQGDPATESTPPPAAPTAGEAGAAEVAGFLEQYNATYLALRTEATEADWNWRVDASEANLTARNTTRAALEDFTGGSAVVQKLRQFRDRIDLSEQQDRQIETAWRLATRRPSGSGDSLRRRDELVQTCLDTLRTADGPVPTPGEPNRTPPRSPALQAFSAERDTLRRLQQWESLLAVGPGLKDGMLELRDLRNGSARQMGYSSWFGLEADDLDLQAAELIQQLDELLSGIMPLYVHIHCWVRHELARRYGAPVPRRIPAYWLNRPWGSPWTGIVEGPDLDTPLSDVQPRWLAETAERNLTSLGFAPLPLTYWGRSDLFPVPSGSAQRKDDRTITLHVDLAQDVRTLTHLRSDFASLEQAHRQTMTAAAMLATDRDELPPLLRRPASGILAQTWPELASLTVRQVPYLQQIGMLAPEETPEPIRHLLSQALRGGIVSLPFLLGTLAHWEYDLYENDLPRHQINTRWWEYAARYQGIVPPVDRGEDACDPAALEVVYTAPGRGFVPALGRLTAHQLQAYLCEEILGGSVHGTPLAGEHKAGRLLHSMMAAGASRPWQLSLQRATGQELSAAALMEYYDPLLQWLQVQNEGREIGF